MKLLALYDTPPDPDGFMRHYRSVHLPLVRKIPGLSKLVLNRITADPTGGAPSHFLIAELHFPDAETFRAAAASAEFRAAGEDLMGFADGLVRLALTEVEEETL